jgi:hypothetical protein
VPDFGKGRLTVSGIVLTSEPMPVAAPADAFTAILPIVPTTRREFERGDRVRAFMRIYQGARVASARVTVRITDAGDRASAETADVLAASRFAPHGAADFTYELPIASLGPGSYLLSIEAKLDAKTAARRDVRFAIR